MNNRTCTYRHAITAVTVLMLTTLAVAQPADRPSSMFVTPDGDGPHTELTIYNDDFALVRQRRALAESLDTGMYTLRYTDVAAALDPTSVHLAGVDNNNAIRVLEQNFEFDLVSSDKLLEKYLDKDIQAITEDGHLHEGRMLSFDSNQIILATDAGVSMISRKDNIRRMKLLELPDGPANPVHSAGRLSTSAQVHDHEPDRSTVKRLHRLTTRPTLVWDVAVRQAGRHTLEVSYITNRLKWQADYNALLADDEQSLMLTGWVTIDNRSGAAYEQASVALVAGEVATDRNRSYGFGPQYYKSISEFAPSSERGDDIAEQLGEYHLYNLDEPTTVRDKQVKQVELLAANEVPVEKIYVYDGSQVRWNPWQRYDDPGFGRQENTKVNVLLQVENRADHNLGFILPKGKVRVYKADTDGSAQFVGEDLIAHTPRDERMMLYIGDAFDIVGERTQTDFTRISDRVIEESFEIAVRNHKDTAVTVRVVEKMYRASDWTIENTSMQYEKMDSRTVEFRPTIETDGEATITYTVRYRW